MLAAEAEIASIGFPIGGSSEAIRLSPIWSFSGDAYTTRRELCIAADGVGIRLFSLHTRRPLFNYILSTEVELTCPTLSIVSQGNDGVETRHTYYTTRSQLFKFSHPTNQDVARRISPSPSPLPETLSNSQFIRPFPRHRSEPGQLSPSVLVADGTGNLAIFSVDSRDPPSTGCLSNVGGQILDLRPFAYSQLQQTLLSTRQDILVNIDSSATYLAGLIHDVESSVLHLKLWSLQSSSTSLQASLIEDAHLSFSTGSYGALTSATFPPDFTSIACLTFRNEVVLWSTDQGSISKVKVPQEVVSACVVSAEKVLISTVLSLTLMETAYGSKLGILRLDNASSQREAQNESIGKGLRLVFFDSASGAAIAQRGRSSLLIDSTVFPELRRSSATIVLADIVGKNHGDLTEPSNATPQEANQDDLQRLHTILEIDDLKTMDSSLKAFIAGDSSTRSAKERKRKREPGPVTSPVVKTILSSMFRVSETGKLEIRRLPPRSFAWLAGRGLTSQQSIISSLRFSFPKIDLHDMSQTAFLDSFMAHPPSVGLLRFVILGKHILDLKEICYLLHYLVCASFDQTSPETPALLTNGPSGEDANQQQDLMDASTLEQLASSVCLEMHRFDLASLRSTMSSTLDVDELYNIIHYLRIRLMHGGWFSACYENHGAVAKNGDGALFSAIVKVFTATIDAIGHRGGFNGSINSTTGAPVDEDTKVVRYMRAEIATVLQGVEDSTTLSKFLSEFCDYVSLIKPSAPAKEDSVNSTSISSREQNLLPLSIPNRKQGKPISKREKRYLKHKSLGQYSFDRIRL